MKTCQKCGAEVERDDSYCPDCGVKLETATKKITVITVLKILGLILFFASFFYFFKNTPLIAILFLILFLIWGVLNMVLKKLFNTEISTGVKMIITVAVIVIVIMGVRQTSSMTAKISPLQPQFMEEARVHELNRAELEEQVMKLNDVTASRDYGLLESMLKEDKVSKEVFEDIHSMLESRKDFNMYFKTQDLNFYENKAELRVMVIIRTDYEERLTGALFLLENTGLGWKLISIQPRLLDIQLPKSLEETATHKIEKIPKPVTAISKSDVSGYLLKKMQ